MDLSKCSCDKAGFCPVFRRDMDSKNHHWCQTSSKDKKINYYQQNVGVLKKDKPKDGSMVIPAVFYDRLPEKKSNIAICTIPANDAAMRHLNISRDSIASYAKRCGADYIELRGDQHEQWPMSNKYRLYQVTSKYDKTLYVDCDVIIKPQASNIFDSTPDDKISIIDEYSEIENDRDWIREEKRAIANYFNIKYVDNDIMFNAGVMVIPRSLCEYYKEPTKPYPKYWCFDQNYLCLTLPEKFLNLLDLKWNKEYIHKSFNQTNKDAFFLHINAPYEIRESCMSSFAKNRKTTKPKLVSEKNIFCKHHRSGWNDVLCRIDKEENGILLDDMVECSFLASIEENTRKRIIPYKTPWVGIIHHPPSSPSWFYELNYKITLEDLFKEKQFIESLKNCKGIITLSEHLKKCLEKTEQLKHIPMKALKLCKSNKTFPKWDAELAKKNKEISFLGYWYRKFYHFVKLNTDYKKTILSGDVDAAKWYMSLESRFDKTFDMIETENINFSERLTNEDYDCKLTSSVCMLDFFDSAANTSLIDCIERNTPVIIPKIPPVIEYLGEEYPLYFDEVKDIENILSSFSRIEEASKYIEDMNKDSLDVNNFNKSVQKFISEL